jgi:cellulose synthase/poly-beta-1,6-N-acetylglucosamine synthase-like glycosyltransferase
MLKLIYYIIDVSIIVYGLYYIITGIFVFIKKKNIIHKFPSTKRFAIIIAARNEAKVIGNLINSLNKQNYPKELYDIYVLPNNCKDNTEQVALDKGAKIIDCSQIKVSSKGDALRHAFKYIFENNDNYDAFSIFDADNIVHPNFLSRMNDTLCEGYQVAQGYRDSKNPSDSWISSCYSIYYWVQNFFFNESRMNMGWSASINGTGFIISTDVIKKYGFNTTTLTEDIEFTAQCACNNCRIAFVKDAITYDEQPTSFKESWKQRKRWSTGTIQCLRKYTKPLGENAIKHDVPQCLDMVIFFLAPIMQIVGFLFVVLIFAYNILNLPVCDIFQVAYMYKGLSIIIAYVGSIVISAVVLLIEEKKIFKVYTGLLTMMIFMLSWIPINIACLFNKKTEWEPIEHTKDMDIESLI